jgi:hypothetical protein
MERETGIEPATSSLGSWRSTAELLPLTRLYPNNIMVVASQAPFTRILRAPVGTPVEAPVSLLNRLGFGRHAL